jgi:NAD(P)-dependent dehydrogenase (short-subunit alcohol dehydrogenase family)
VNGEGARGAPRVALVTGAGGGIGGAVCRGLLRSGARVVAVDRDPARLPPAAPALWPVVADVAVTAGCGAAVAAALGRFGALHALVNAAGGSGRAAGDGPVDACSDQGWEAVLAGNLGSVFRMCRAALPALLGAEGASIVNVASVLGLVGGGELFATHAYAASKAGVVGLTRAMAVHYAPQGLRVNAVCPGLTDTPMAARALADPATAAHVARMQPLLRGPATAEQVAGAVLFLLSDAAAAVTGAVLPADGGWTAQ